jgi:ribose-phosphate pyrophosphokinase
MPAHESMMICAGTSHPVLAQKLVDHLHWKLGSVEITTFPDHEIGVRVLDDVRDKQLFVFQTMSGHPNRYLMELLIIVDALKRASARSITAVIPYFGYARQDRRAKGREPITAKLVAGLLEKAGVNRLITLDLHADQIEGFFDIPVDNLSARSLMVEATRQWKLSQLIVVAPDIGSIKLAKAFAKQLKAGYAVVEKRRVSGAQVEAETLIGDVKGKQVLLVDDICSTGATIRAASRVCKQAGATRIVAAVTHGLFVDKGFEESEVEKIIVTDSVPLPDTFDRNRVTTVSIAPLLAQAIEV